MRCVYVCVCVSLFVCVRVCEANFMPKGSVDGPTVVAKELMSDSVRRYECLFHVNIAPRANGRW